MSKLFWRARWLYNRNIVESTYIYVQDPTSIYAVELWERAGCHRNYHGVFQNKNNDADSPWGTSEYYLYKEAEDGKTVKRIHHKVLYSYLS